MGKKKAKRSIKRGAFGRFILEEKQKEKKIRQATASCHPAQRVGGGWKKGKNEKTTSPLQNVLTAPGTGSLGDLLGKSWEGNDVEKTPRKGHGAG